MQILADRAETTDVILRPRSFNNRNNKKKSDVVQTNPTFNISISIGVFVLGLTVDRNKAA